MVTPSGCTKRGPLGMDFWATVTFHEEQSDVVVF